jgi:hypothetical protein
MERSGNGAKNILVLSLEGTFDAAHAWRLHDTLEQLAQGTRVSLDFRGVHAFHDFAIALLARDILARAGRIEATGLCQHQRRILKYFGVGDAGLGEPSAPEAPGAQAPREDAGDSLGL